MDSSHRENDKKRAMKPMLTGLATGVDNEVHTGDANGAEIASMTSEDYESHLLGESLMESLASGDTPAHADREGTGRAVYGNYSVLSPVKNELMAPPADLAAKFTALDLNDVHGVDPFISARATWMRPTSPLSSANATAADAKFTSIETSMTHEAALPMPNAGLGLQDLPNLNKRTRRKKKATGTAAVNPPPHQYWPMPYYDYSGYYDQRELEAAVVPDYEPTTNLYHSSYSTLSPWDMGSDRFVQPQFIPPLPPPVPAKKRSVPAPAPPPLTQSFAAAASKKLTKTPKAATAGQRGGKKPAPAPSLTIAGGKKPKKCGTSTSAFLSTFPIVNPTARIDGQTMINGVDVRTLKFVKPSRQCLYWRVLDHKWKQPYCPYWHPREICKYHPYCPMGAVVCGFGHPFCSDKHYCRCNPRTMLHFNQFNHLERPTEDWEHQGYRAFFLANGGSVEQFSQDFQASSRSRVKQTSSNGKQWMTGPHQQDSYYQPGESPPSPPHRVVTYMDEMLKPPAAECIINATSTASTEPRREVKADARKAPPKGRGARGGGNGAVITGGKFVSLASFRTKTPSNSGSSSDDEKDEDDGGSG